jgi:hypothetical protein
MALGPLAGTNALTARRRVSESLVSTRLVDGDAGDGELGGGALDEESDGGESNLRHDIQCAFAPFSSVMRHADVHTGISCPAALHLICASKRLPSPPTIYLLLYTSSPAVRVPHHTTLSFTLSSITALTKDHASEEHATRRVSRRDGAHSPASDGGPSRMGTRRTHSCAAFARSSLVKLVRRPRSARRCTGARFGCSGADAAGRLIALDAMHRQR